MNRRSIRIAVGLNAFLGLAGTSAVGHGGVKNEQTAAPTTIQASGAISGVVRDARTARPIAGAVVTLQWPGNNRVAQKTTMTDSKGRFVFTRLPASDGYFTRTTKPGYTTDVLGQSFPSGSGIGGAGARIVLADGEWIDNIDIRLWPPGAISGRVVDERGEPVVGVPVRVLAQFPIAGAFRLVAGPMGKTDDRGMYRIAGLPHGRYLVILPSVQSVVPASTPVTARAGMTPEQFARAVAPGTEPPNSAGIERNGWRLVVGNYAVPPPPTARAFQVYPPLFYPNASSARAATPIDLEGGDDRQNVDFAMQPVPVVQVSGRMTDPADAVAGLVVRLMPEGSESLGQGCEVATALVNADGSFTFLAVPAGRYTLEARSTVAEFVRGSSVAAAPATPGMVNVTNMFTIGGSLPGGTLRSIRDTTGNDATFGHLHLDVGSDDVTNVVVEMRRSVTVSGRLIYEGETRPKYALRPSIEPADGSPELAIVTPVPTPGQPPDTFAISGLKDGEYFLRVDAGSTLVVKSIAGPNGDYTNRPFDASSGADISGVIVTLTDKVASLAGAVRDRQGAPVTEGVVIVFPAESSLWTRFGLSPRRTKTTSFYGPTGYKLTGLPGGDYFVVAVDTSMLDAWHDPRFYAAAVSAATRVTLDWGQARQQDLVIREVVIK